jgi:hypothetical protein
MHKEFRERKKKRVRKNGEKNKVLKERKQIFCLILKIEIFPLSTQDFFFTSFRKSQKSLKNLAQKIFIYNSTIKFTGRK